MMAMNKWKKLGITAMAAAAVLGLAACGNGTKKNKSSSPAPKTITVSVDKGYKKYINTIKPKFEKDNHVKIKMVNKDMLDQLDALSLDGPAGKAPDVMMAPFDRIGSLAQQGHLAPVKLVNGRYGDTAAKTTIFNSESYGAPVVIESIVTYYNKKLVDKAPTTFKDLEKLAKDPKFAYENDKTKNVVFLEQLSNFYYSYGMIKGYGGYVFGRDNTDVKDIGLNNAGAVKAVDYIANWYKKVWPRGMQDVKSVDNFITDQFTTGKTAVVIEGPWKAASYKDAKVDYGVTVLPTLDNGDKYHAFGGGKAWVMSNYSKNKTLDQKFINYISNDKNQETFFKMTAEVPANQAAQEAAKQTGDALTTAVIDQFKDDVPLINTPEVSEVWDPGQSMITNAASGKYTAKQAADRATKLIKTNIQQKYHK